MDTIRFVNPIAFVRDIASSTAFYRDVVGLSVAADHGTIVIFEGHFAIHDGAALTRTVWQQEPDGTSWGRGNVLYYFEASDIDACFARMGDKVDLIHPLQLQPWGQRVFRFTDPDGHAVEIGEPMATGA